MTPTAQVNLKLAGFLFLLSLGAGVPDILTGYWRFDDGGHLMWALQHNLFDYFFDLEVTRKVVMGQLTPWNTFFYDLNLNLFGFRADLMYLHLHLASAGAVSLFFLLLVKLGCNRWLSVLFAVLFLLGPPWHEASRNLMTGHYVYGMLFMQAGLLSALHAIEAGVRNRRKYAFFLVGSVLLYVLALTCKELYVPAPFLLMGAAMLFRERNDGVAPRDWIYPLVAWFAALLLYFLFRSYVLGSFLGSYLTANYSHFFHPMPLWQRVAQSVVNVVTVPVSGFWWMNTIFYLCLSVLLLFSLRRAGHGTRLALAFFFLATFPVVAYIGFSVAPYANFMPPRYAAMLLWSCLAAAAVCITLARQGGSSPRFAAGLVVLTLFSASFDYLRIRPALRESETYYRYALESGEENDLLVLPPASNYIDQLWAIRKVYASRGISMAPTSWVLDGQNFESADTVACWIWSAELQRLTDCRELR